VVFEIEDDYESAGVDFDPELDPKMSLLRDGIRSWFPVHDYLVLFSDFEIQW
jgi:hypothetical protein